jgi:hypothetical protein
MEILNIPPEAGIRKFGSCPAERRGVDDNGASFEAGCKEAESERTDLWVCDETGGPLKIGGCLSSDKDFGTVIGV